MYVYHRDIAGNQWNVFKKVNGNEEYVCSYLSLADAKGFCDRENGARHV